MPYARGPVTPRNMGTQQCENIDVETQNTVGTDLGVHTSDPLLKVAKWIAYLTKVSYFHVKDVIVTSFFTQIGPIVIAVAYLPLFPSLPSASANVLCYSSWFSSFSLLCILFLGWRRNCLVLPPLLVGQTITTPTSWDPTGGHL